jgi:REP element-mobilizing transposase RayT
LRPTFKTPHAECNIDRIITMDIYRVVKTKVNVIILNWNGLGDTIHCLKSLIVKLPLRHYTNTMNS